MIGFYKKLIKNICNQWYILFCVSTIAFLCVSIGIRNNILIIISFLSIIGAIIGVIVKSYVPFRKNNRILLKTLEDINDSFFILKRTKKELTVAFDLAENLCSLLWLKEEQINTFSEKQKEIFNEIVATIIKKFNKIISFYDNKYKNKIIEKNIEENVELMLNDIQITVTKLNDIVSKSIEEQFTNTKDSLNLTQMLASNLDVARKIEIREKEFFSNLIEDEFNPQGEF